MKINLALDTCVLSDISFVTEMSKRPDVHLVVPSVVYMERRRQLLNHKKDPNKLDQIMRRSNIEIVPFDKNAARTAAELMNEQIKVCPSCNKLDWTDVMILSSIDKPQSILITRNIKDLQPYGREDRLMTPDEAWSRFRGWAD